MSTERYDCGDEPVSQNPIFCIDCSYLIKVDGEFHCICPDVCEMVSTPIKMEFKRVGDPYLLNNSNDCKYFTEKKAAE